VNRFKLNACLVDHVVAHWMVAVLARNKELSSRQFGDSVFLGISFTFIVLVFIVLRSEPVIVCQTFGERNSKDVPVDDEAISFCHYPEIVGENNGCDHVDCVVRSQSDHQEDLTKHCQYGKDAP